MTFDWTPLQAELALWRHAGRDLPIWWRDDDAVALTPALEHLSGIAQDLGVPVYVAIIPSLVEPTLAPFMANQKLLVPVIHGWRHISHSPEGAKNAEFGHMRADAKSELASAMATMQTHFDDNLLPMFVPPWNRITPELWPALQQEKYAAVSTYGPRQNAEVAKGLTQINTHIDPIFWRGHRGLVDPEKLISDLVDALRERRERRTDATEPLGLLTHHLVHTSEVWQFAREVLSELLEGGAYPADLRQLLHDDRRPSI